MRRGTRRRALAAVRADVRGTVLAGALAAALVTALATGVPAVGASAPAGALVPAGAPTAAPMPQAGPVAARDRTPPTVFGLSARDHDALAEAERVLGVRAGVVGVFNDWTQPFPMADVEQARQRGATLLISWEPHDSELGTNRQPAFALDRIVAGDHDAYIRTWAREAARVRGVRVIVRWAAEMNGDWLPWSTGHNGNGPGDYVAAWRHVRSLVRAQGATRLRWMFNPIVTHEGSYPLRRLWPGDAYVDWVGLDGYNWGSLRPWGWRSWQEIFAPGLVELASVTGSQPLAIAEMATAPGPAQARWVRAALRGAQAAGARMVVWFEHDKETDWRLTSSAAAIATVRDILGDDGWATGVQP